MVSAALLILSLVLLSFVGQTMIFLLRLVAADRRSRRRPLAPTARKTVGDLEDIPRFGSIDEILATGYEADATQHTEAQPKVGDRVSIVKTEVTEAAGFAGRIGTAGGWTTPSQTGVAVVGSPVRDHAHGVNFEDGSSAWFDPDLVVPTPESADLDQDQSVTR
jgi:hypothetical protein